MRVACVRACVCVVRVCLYVVVFYAVCMIIADVVVSSIFDCVQGLESLGRARYLNK